MKKGMYLICRVYHGRIFFFISSASLSFWLLFGNFFFFQLIFSTLMKDQTGNSLVQAEAMFQ